MNFYYYGIYVSESVAKVISKLNKNTALNFSFSSLPKYYIKYIKQKSKVRI